MFNFLYPRPVVDGRAVAVQIAEQKASARQNTRTLIVTTKSTTSPELTKQGGSSEKK